MFCPFGVIPASHSLKHSLVLQYAKYDLKKPMDVNRKILIDVNGLWIEPKNKKECTTSDKLQTLLNRVLEAEAFASEVEVWTCSNLANVVLCIFCCGQHFYFALIIGASAIFKDLGRVFFALRNYRIVFTVIPSNIFYFSYLFCSSSFCTKFQWSAIFCKDQ